MGDILRRRRMMAAASGGSSAPLYSFDDMYSDGTANGVNAGYTTLQTSGGNHFKYLSRYRGNTYRKWLRFHEITGAFDSTWTPLFTLFAGDEVVLKLKDGYVYNNQAKYNGYAQLTMRDASDANVMGWTGSTSDSPLWTQKKEKREFTELSITKTIEQDTDICDFRFYGYGNTQQCYVTLEADIELYVNGVRYI